MTTHNGTNERETWQKVKARIVARYRTVVALAAILECHPNSIRYATQGRCPRVLKRMKEML